MAYIRSHRRLLLLACSLVLFFLSLTPSQAGGGSSNGCPPPGDVVEYYSDATYTTQVGYCSSNCCNCTACTCSGQITPYAVHIPVNWLWCD